MKQLNQNSLAHPNARRHPVPAPITVKIAAGAGMIVSLLVCQGQIAPNSQPPADIEIKKLPGEMPAPRPVWQEPSTQPTSQPATRPSTPPPPPPESRLRGDVVIRDPDWKLENK